MRLGIDFGTTHTVVAAAVRGRYPVAAFESEAGYAEHLPGLAVLEGERLHFGQEAVAALRRNPRGVVRSIKRSVTALAPSDPVAELWGSGITALDLVTSYLGFVRDALYERSNLDIEPGDRPEVMIAVPANASTRQRYLTMEAFTQAGFHVLGMVNEPTAAAVEFAERHLGAVGRRSPKRYVIVYDLGGGTFDTAAVSLAGRRFELLASEGLNKLGGDDFDEIILAMALETVGRNAAELSPAARVRLLDVCRDAKERLTTTCKRLLIDLSGELPETQPVVLDVRAVLERCEPLVMRTMTCLDTIFGRLRSYGVDPENLRELGAIYLVGGGSSFVAVPRLLKAEHRRKVQLAVQPHAATAIGLAVAADPEAQLFVRESSTRHFGVWREAENGHEQVFDQIVSKDTAALGERAIVVERSYRPVHAVGHLRFLECSALTPSGQPAGDVIPWGEVYFPYDPALEHHERLEQFRMDRRTGLGEQQIVERYTYAADGMIAVEIENRSRGYRRRFVLGELS